MMVRIRGRRKVTDVEEIGVIRRTIQDVLVPEMQGIKERLAGYDETFVSIQQRFDQVDRRFDAGKKTLTTTLTFPLV